MATTIEELRAVMRMELKPFMRDLQQMNGINAKAAKQVEQTWRETNRRLDGIGKNMAQSLIAPLTGVGAALGARELIRLTDVWTDLNGRVRIAAGGMEEGAAVMDRLGDIARRTYSSLEVTAESYLVNSRSLKELGYNTNQALDFTEALNNALVVSGAKGQRATQVVDALGKAMALGELRGDELNTVIQTGGRVAEALAAGLGVTTNELRKLGEQGKLKSSSVFAALTSQMKVLRDEADGMQATIGDALQLLNNSFLEYVGGADQAAGASARIAEGIIFLADNLDTVGNAALFAAQAIAGALAGRALVGAGVQIVTTTKALAEFVRIARAAQGLGGLGPAFASLGSNAGVIGLVVGGAAALALGHFANQAIEAELRTDRFNAMLERMGIVAEASAEKIDEATAAQTRLSTAEGLAAVQQETQDAAIKLAEFEAGLEDLAGQFRLGAQAGFEQQAAISEVVDEYQRGEIGAQALKDELDKLAARFPDWAGDIADLQGWVAKIEQAQTAVGNLATEMARITPITDPDRAAASWPGMMNFRRGPQVTTDLGDFPEWNKPTTFGDFRTFATSGSRSSRSGGTKTDPYGDATKEMQRRIDMLVEETRLLGDINPLIDDYGFSLEKLRAVQELENAATKAGIELGPERRGEIEKLATAYASVTAEAQRQAEAQNASVARFEELKDSARSALETIINGFIEGKNAGDIFADVLKNVGSQLWQMGLNSLFGGGSTAGNGLFGQLFNFPRREFGGPVRKGQPYIVGEKRAEMFVPDSNGRIIPQVPATPSLPAMSRGSDNLRVEMPITIDARGADAAGMARVSAQLAQLQAELPGRVKEIVKTRGTKWR